MEYEYLDHTADVKFRATGKSLEEAFSNSAFAMFNVMVKTKEVGSDIAINFSIEGIDLKSLLFNFIDEFIFHLDTQNFFLSKIEEIKITKKGEKYLLDARVLGDDANKYDTIGPQVKAATYNQMKIDEKNGKWIVEAVIDI